MSLTTSSKYLFFGLFIIIFGYILYVNISDIIYGFSLFYNKIYYSQFSFLSLTPPSSRRANILGQGIYSGVNLNSAWQILKQNILALDLEVAILALVFALIYKYQMVIAKIEKELNLLSDITYRVSLFYGYTVIFTAFITTIIVINNLIPFHGLDFYCFWFGLVTFISASLKLLFSLMIGWIFFLLIKKQILDVKIQVEN